MTMTTVIQHLFIFNTIYINQDFECLASFQDYISAMFVGLIRVFGMDKAIAVYKLSEPSSTDIGK